MEIQSFFNFQQEFPELLRTFPLVSSPFLVHDVGHVYWVNSIWVDWNEEATDGERHKADDNENDWRVLNWWLIGLNILDQEVNHKDSQESYAKSDQQGEYNLNNTHNRTCCNVADRQLESLRSRGAEVSAFNIDHSECSWGKPVEDLCANTAETAAASIQEWGLWDIWLFRHKCIVNQSKESQ